MKPKPQAKEIDLVPIADTHTGGITALHPNVRKDKRGKWQPLTDMGGWHYKNNPHFYLTSKQVDIWNHFEKCLDYVAENRTGRLFVLHMGDATDGDHHHTNQLVTHSVTEQKNTHIELMQYALQRMKFDRGDMLAYLEGTESHVGDEEEDIARQLNAYQYPDGSYCAPFLEMNMNGALVWAYHHGVAAGDYPTRGEALTRALKKIYYQCKMRGARPPDLVLSAHTHDPVYSTYTQDYHTMHGVILPSFQDKTRFANGKVPLSVNKIGLQHIKIGVNGEIKVNKPLLMESERGEVITVG